MHNSRAHSCKMILALAMVFGVSLLSGYTADRLAGAKPAPNPKIEASRSLRQWMFAGRGRAFALLPMIQYSRQGR